MPTTMALTDADFSPSTLSVRSGSGPASTGCVPAMLAPASISVAPPATRDRPGPSGPRAAERASSCRARSRSPRSVHPSRRAGTPRSCLSGRYRRSAGALRATSGSSAARPSNRRTNVVQLGEVRAQLDGCLPDTELLRGSCSCGWRGIAEYPLDWTTFPNDKPLYEVEVDLSGPIAHYDAHLSVPRPAEPAVVDVPLRRRWHVRPAAHVEVDRLRLAARWSAAPPPTPCARPPTP